MEFRRGKAKTVGGLPATLLMLTARGEYPIVGVVHHRDCDEPTSWTKNGRLLTTKTTMTDLATEDGDGCGG